ncbi:MAG TPA: hypothetical protein V6C81_11360 [Planktothrix sp.]|jgi:hypothetical protein
MILYLVGGAIAALVDLFFRLTDEDLAFTINWVAIALYAVAGMAAAALSSFTLTGEASTWPQWSHLLVGLFAGTISYILCRASSQYFKAHPVSLTSD